MACTIELFRRYFIPYVISWSVFHCHTHFHPSLMDPEKLKLLKELHSKGKLLLACLEILD
jgi:hypothetical protein